MRKLWLTMAVAVMLMATSVYAAEDGTKITVRGEGAVVVAPDIARLSLGVSTDHASAIMARNENEAKMIRLLAVLNDLGIAAEDIKTNNYAIYPQRDYRQNAVEVIGYSVSNSVSVTVRNLESVGEVLYQAIEAGANTGGSIQFSVEDPTEFYGKALTLAIANAQGKAILIANALDQTISAPTEIIETSNTAVVPVHMDSAVTESAAAGSSVPIEAGTLTIWASIQAVYSAK